MYIKFSLVALDLIISLLNKSIFYKYMYELGQLLKNKYFYCVFDIVSKQFYNAWTILFMLLTLVVLKKMIDVLLL